MKNCLRSLGRGSFLIVHFVSKDMQERLCINLTIVDIVVVSIVFLQALKDFIRVHLQVTFKLQLLFS